jgi:hypothetical protein
MTLSEQAIKVLEKCPQCMAVHCGLPATETILINGQEIPYCAGHAAAWKNHEKERAFYIQFMKDAKEGEK